MKYRIIEGNSFGQLYQHIQGDFVCIAACKESLPDENNHQLTKELRLTLKKLKLTYWKIKGGYFEDDPELKDNSLIYDSDKESMKKLPAYEDLFLVPYFGEYGDFNAFVLTFEELSHEYNQDAILVKSNDIDKSAYFLYQDGTVENVGKDIKFSNTLLQFSKIRNKDAHAALQKISDEEQGKLIPINENMKFYFESPTSAFSAQSLAINGQYW